MPDRDKFRRLPGGWRRAARSFAALAQGKVSEVDQEAVGQGFVRDLACGVQTLAATLDVFNEFDYQRPLVAEFACDEPACATQGIPRDRNDSLRQEEAERSIMTGQFEPQGLVERFLKSSLLHNVIESKEGVAHVLRAEGTSIDRTQLIQSAEPTIRAFAEQLLERPNGKCFHTELPAHRPVDRDANLLEINSW